MNNFSKFAFTAISLIMFSSLIEGSNSDMSRTFSGDTQDFSAQPQAQNSSVHSLGDSKCQEVSEKGEQEVSPKEEIEEPVEEDVVVDPQSGNGMRMVIANKCASFFYGIAWGGKQLGIGGLNSVSKFCGGVKSGIGIIVKPLTPLLRRGATAVKSLLLAKKTDLDFSAKVQEMNENPSIVETLKKAELFKDKIIRLQRELKKQTMVYEHAVNLQKNLQDQPESYFSLEFLSLKIVKMLPITADDAVDGKLESIEKVSSELKSVLEDLSERLQVRQSLVEQEMEQVEEFLKKIESFREKDRFSHTTRANPAVETEHAPGTPMGGKAKGLGKKQKKKRLENQIPKDGDSAPEPKEIKFEKTNTKASVPAPETKNRKVENTNTKDGDPTQETENENSKIVRRKSGRLQNQQKKS